MYGPKPEQGVVRMEYELKDADENTKRQGSKKRGQVREDMESDEVTEVHVSYE